MFSRVLFHSTLHPTSNKQQATMAQPPHNPLLHPPFFEIPGINPSSPLSTQMEQIDQLNTLLLQEIDANFAKFHQIVTARILPEIKRFAIAGEPTREAAHVSCRNLTLERKLISVLENILRSSGWSTKYSRRSFHHSRRK
jgi:hypothetical protein